MATQSFVITGSRYSLSARRTKSNHLMEQAMLVAIQLQMMHPHPPHFPLQAQVSRQRRKAPLTQRRHSSALLSTCLPSSSAKYPSTMARATCGPSVALSTSCLSAYRLSWMQTETTETHSKELLVSRPLFVLFPTSLTWRASFRA